MPVLTRCPVPPTLLALVTASGLAALAGCRTPTPTSGVKDAAQPDASAAVSAVPELPWAGGSQLSAPWGGPDAARWRPEAVIANAMSEALNDAWRRPDVRDVTVAMPVEMQISKFNQFNDGQLNAAPTFRGWEQALHAHATRPPLLAALVHFASTPSRIFWRVEAAALTGPARALDLAFTGDDGTPQTAVVPLDANGAGDWAVAAGFDLSSPLARRTLLVSSDGRTTWWPLWFRFPVRPTAELLATVPAPFAAYHDGRSIIDREGVSLQTHPAAGQTPFARLNRPGDPLHSFSVPYEHFNPPGIHDRFPADPARPTDFTIVAVGQSFNWTPFKAGAPLVQPFHVHYLCLDKRQAAREAAAPNGGIISGASWHRVDLAAESFVNDLEAAPMLGGFGTLRPVLAPLPSGTYAFGMKDVLTFRLVRPGESFITPAAGTAEAAGGQVVDQSTLHAVFQYVADHPVCVEVWVHACTPDDRFDFAGCATTSVHVAVKNAHLGAGQTLALRATARFVLNLPSKPVLTSPFFQTPDASGRLLPLTPQGGDWGGTFALPQTTSVDYQVVRLGANGAELAHSPVRNYQVPVATSDTLTVPGAVP